MAQDLSKIMGSVDLLKSYISLRKFEIDKIFFFENFEKFDISCGFWVGESHTTVFITSYYSDNINSYWTISAWYQVRIITRREAIIRLYLIYNDL